MPELLTNRAVPRVFVDGIFVARRARGMVISCSSYARYERDQAYALDFACVLGDVYVALDNQNLNYKSHESEEDRQSAPTRHLMRNVRRERKLVSGCSSCVSIVRHRGRPTPPRDQDYRKSGFRSILSNVAALSACRGSDSRGSLARRPTAHLPVYASQPPSPDATQDLVRGCSLGFAASLGGRGARPVHPILGH
jgi:hypothetical protein